MSRPNTLPWNMATFTGNEPVTTLSDNFSSLNSVINDSGAGWSNYAVDTGSANNYAVTLGSAPVSYQSGMLVAFLPANSNSGASVINVNSLGNVSIVDRAGNALLAGAINANILCVILYSGTNFQLVPPYNLMITGNATAGAQTINVAGAPHVNIVRVVTAAGTSSISIQNAAVGMTFFIILSNSSGAPQNYGIQAIGGTHAFFTMTSAGGTILSGDYNVAFSSVANGLAIRVWGTVTQAGVLNMIGILG